jgi:hypothetical protein
MKCEKIDWLVKNPEMPVTVIEMGNIIEVVYKSKLTGVNQTTRILPNGEYMDLRTGEIKQCVKHGNRISQGKSLLRTFKHLRGIINSNVIDTDTVHWVTLTYVENMTEPKRLYTDFKNFNKRWQRYIAKSFQVPKVEYIVIAEPQERGAWHCHLLYLYGNKAPYVPNDKLSEIWGHGFVSIKKLENVDNVGAYLTAYLTNLPIDNDENVNGQRKSKALAKGMRLFLYPKGFRIYRTSRGVKRPIETTMPLWEAEKRVEGITKTYDNTFRIIDEYTHFELDVNKCQYNKLRKE